MEEEIIETGFDVEMDGEEDDFEISWYGQTNEEDDKFDEFVGALQEIVINEEFETIQNAFFSK